MAITPTMTLKRIAVSASFAASLILAGCNGSTDMSSQPPAGAAASSPTTEEAPLIDGCDHNPLAKVLPAAQSINGFRWSGTTCRGAMAWATYKDRDREITAKVIDATGELGKNTEPGARLAADVQRETGKASQYAYETSLAMAKETIQGSKSTPELLEGLGGPNYLPIVFSYAGSDNFFVLGEAKGHGSPAIKCSGEVRGRYLASVTAEGTPADLDTPARQAIVEPFVRAMDFSQVP